MNGQILKLAASFFPRDSEGNIYTTPEIITEFAEFIVRECIDTAYQEGDNVAYLALHFGVEE